MKKFLMVTAMLVGILVVGGTFTKTAEAHPGGYGYGHCGPYRGGYGYRPVYPRPYGYRYAVRPYAPAVMMPAPGFGISTPGFSLGVGTGYGYPAPYSAYGYGGYGW